jgi:hypothetical protein
MEEWHGVSETGWRMAGWRSGRCGGVVGWRSGRMGKLQGGERQGGGAAGRMRGRVEEWQGKEVAGWRSGSVEDWQGGVAAWSSGR